MDERTYLLSLAREALEQSAEHAQRYVHVVHRLGWATAEPGAARTLRRKATVAAALLTAALDTPPGPLPAAPDVRAARAALTTVLARRAASLGPSCQRCPFAQRRHDGVHVCAGEPPWTIMLGEPLPEVPPAFCPVRRSVAVRCPGCDDDAPPLGAIVGPLAPARWCEPCAILYGWAADWPRYPPPGSPDLSQAP